MLISLSRAAKAMRALPNGVPRAAAPAPIICISMRREIVFIACISSGGLMPEVAHAGEDHGEAGGVGGGDDRVVAQRTAGLDHGFGAGVGDRLQAIGKGEEGVR